MSSSPSQTQASLSTTAASQRERDEHFLALALEEARRGHADGHGIPIGAVLVARDGTTILGRGHNKRVQRGSAVLHGEMDALENAGRLSGAAYKGATVS